MTNFSKEGAGTKIIDYNGREGVITSVHGGSIIATFIDGPKEFLHDGRIYTSDVQPSIFLPADYPFRENKKCECVIEEDVKIIPAKIEYVNLYTKTSGHTSNYHTGIDLYPTEGMAKNAATNEYYFKTCPIVIAPEKKFRKRKCFIVQIDGKQIVSKDQVNQDAEIIGEGWMWEEIK